MKPIWIVDDDQSIRFVLEKALAREQTAVRSFSSGREVRGALEHEDEREAVVTESRMAGGLGVDSVCQGKGRPPRVGVPGVGGVCGE